MTRRRPLRRTSLSSGLRFLTLAETFICGYSLSDRFPAVHLNFSPHVVESFHLVRHHGSMMACISAWRPFGMLANERTASAVRLSRSVSAAHSGERSSSIRRASRPSSAMVLPADALGLVDDLVALALEDDPDRAHRLFLQGVLPVAVARGQVAPGGAGAQDSEHGADEPTVVLGRPSPLAPLAWEQVLDEPPRAVVDVVAVAVLCHAPSPSCRFVGMH